MTKIGVVQDDNVIYTTEYCIDEGDGARNGAQRRSSVNGPRTSTFCNSLRHNTIQNNPVRGPLKKVGTTNKLNLYLVER